MSEHLINQTRGRWKGVLISLGLSADALTGKHCPCPICGGKDRFRFDDKDGSGSFFCNHCGSGYGVHLVEKFRRVDRASAWNLIEGVVDGTVVGEAVEAGPDRTEQARRIWLDSEPVDRDGPVGRYLIGRGISLDRYPETLRQCERLYLEGGEFHGKFPAMVWIIGSTNNRAVGVHLTYLTRSGAKAPVPNRRRVFGSLPAGSAIRTCLPGAVLGIAEGIETALSASRLFGIPCWAAINAGSLAKWEPPAETKEIVVFGDNDRNFAGQAAAYALAHRLANRKLTVRIEIPPTAGDDWNDVLLKGSAQ